MSAPTDPPSPHGAPSDPPPVDRRPKPPPPTVDRRRVLALGGIGATAVLGAAALTAPRPRRLGEPSGDESLTSALAPYLAGHSRVGIAVLDPDVEEPRLAGFGTDDGEGAEEFEIGSVSKTFTGALLALAIEHGEADLSDTVADILGEGATGSDIADVQLEELATHTSGLPTIPPSRLPLTIPASLLRKDPYAGRDAGSVIADALAVTPTGRGDYAYSNLAIALLGQLLVRLVGPAYPELLRERVLDPLGLAATTVPEVPANLAPTARDGAAVSGLPAAPWTMAGTAPAGGIRSTPADMATYLQAMRDGTAPGASAATEVLRERSGTRRTAMTWHHLDLDGEAGTVIWHNGMTGGYASFVGWSRDTGLGVVLLTDTALSLDEAALAVLAGEVER